MSEYYNYYKALHIIFIVTWFSGLFYMGRLLIYYVECGQRSQPEKDILQTQLKLMQRRLWYGITWPSAIITLIFGWLLYSNFVSAFGFAEWLKIKLVFVFFLYVYHFYCHRIFKKQQSGDPVYSSNQLRMFNEIATIFLVAIVFLVVLKNTLSMVYGVIGLVVFSIILLIAIKTYKRIRESKP
jgi:protoporphyrinogen IX oxidase